MRKTTILFLALLPVLLSGCMSLGSISLTAPGVKWKDSYSFDRSNVFKIDFYAKNNELLRTQNYRTYFQSAGDDFVTKMIPDGKSLAIETVIDKTNMVAIQIFGAGAPGSTYNAGRFKYPADSELKKLDLMATDTTRQILGITCKKYTYTYKQIFGEVWLTDKVTMPNDLGVFRAAKMAALHNTLSVPGFVMEMTTQDSTGAKTVMSTVSLKNAENYTVNLKSADMQTAINTVNYYTF